MTQESISSPRGRLRIDHVGVVVEDLTSAVEAFVQVLDIPESDVSPVIEVLDPESDEMLNIVLVTLGDQRIEFLSAPPGSDARVAKHHARHGDSLFHISLYVDGFSEHLNYFRQAKGPIEPVTLTMNDPNSPDRSNPRTRIVDIAWLPESLTAGIQLEFVDANPAPQ